MDVPKPRNAKILLRWFLGNVLLQVAYLSALLHFCRKKAGIDGMTAFYGMLTLTGLYVLPTLGYVIMPEGQSRKFDRGFIVWGCVTTFFLSLVVLAHGHR